MTTRAPPKTVTRRMPYGWRPAPETLVTISASKETDFPSLGVGRIPVAPTAGAWAHKNASDKLPTPVQKTQPSKQATKIYWDEMSSDWSDDDLSDDKYAKKTYDTWGAVAGL